MEHLKSSLLLQACGKNMSVKIIKGLIQDGAIAFIIQSHKCLIPLTGGNSTLRDNKQVMIILIYNLLI